MQKSKNITIIILIIILAYFLFSQFYLESFGSVYVYIINPIFFIALSIILKFIIVSPYKVVKYNKIILQYVLSAAFIYVFIYLFSGIFFTYGKNPYSITFKGIMLNLYSIGMVILLKEYIRYKLVNNIFRKDKKLIYILIVIVFSIYEISIKSIINNFSAYYIFRMFFTIIVPVITKNCMLTYIEKYANYKICVLYELILHAILWVSPILPNSPWVFNAVLDIIFPLVLVFYSVYIISSKDKEHILKSDKPIKPKSIIPWAVLTVIIVWFVMGIFPVKPVGILTGSMEPSINVGDVVIIQKCSAKDIEIDDVIEYQKDNYKVVHRVVNKYTEDDKIFFITKGDNNSDNDFYPVGEEQVSGKMITVIPFIAKPIVWVKDVDNVDPDIELGK